MNDKRRKLWVITFEVNDYDQYGEYFHSVHLTEEDARKAVPYFGRKKATMGSDHWYYLRHVAASCVFQDGPYLPPQENDDE